VKDRARPYRKSTESFTAVRIGVNTRLERGVQMKKQDFDNLVESVREAGRIRRGEGQPSRVTQYAPIDVKTIRLRLGKSQAQFALMIGVSVSTLQNWEQGRRRPEGPARALLRVAAANPEAVAAALAN
jgi:putative transcriptional regulator